MKIDAKILSYISSEVGDAFYILDTKRFENNYHELLDAFRKYYEKTEISYSYKTNYIPNFCQIVNRLGGYAEVVSDMEMNIAKNLEVPYENIIFNGPYKKEEAVEELIINNGIINLDSLYDFNIIKKIMKKYPNKKFKIGLRCNFDIDDGIISRFGFDFHYVMDEINERDDLILSGLHIHFATRSLKKWPNKIEGLLRLIDKYKLYQLEYISIGGGMFGKMKDELKCQFSDDIPSYEDYAEVIAKNIRDFYSANKVKEIPILFLEPGSALVGDCMKFIAKVLSIKIVRGKEIATLLGSIYNINPTLNTKNPPIEIIRKEENSKAVFFANDMDFGGYTCIESDYMYKHFKGEIAVYDYVVFDNVGSYSIVLKPPFILPNFPIIEIVADGYKIVKDEEKFEDLFKTYKFI